MDGDYFRNNYDTNVICTEIHPNQVRRPLESCYFLRISSWRFQTRFQPKPKQFSCFLGGFSWDGAFQTSIRDILIWKFLVYGVKTLSWGHLKVFTHPLRSYCYCTGFRSVTFVIYRDGKISFFISVICPAYGSHRCASSIYSVFSTKSWSNTNNHGHFFVNRRETTQKYDWWIYNQSQTTIIFIPT
jgi:hypothetical protein